MVLSIGCGTQPGDTGDQRRHVDGGLDGYTPEPNPQCVGVGSDLSDTDTWCNQDIPDGGPEEPDACDVLNNGNLQYVEMDCPGTGPCNERSVERYTTCKRPVLEGLGSYNCYWDPASLQKVPCYEKGTEPTPYE